MKNVAGRACRSEGHRLLRLALLTDADAERREDGWRVRCLHCRHALHLTAAGTPLDGASLEHVVPRSWFGKRAAAPLIEGLAGPDDPRNLAVACARCNQQKGKGPDAEGPGDARAFAVVQALQAARLARFRAPSARCPDG